MRFLVGVVLVAALQSAVATFAIAAPLSARPQIALTFDDAPQAAPPLLLILGQKDVKATFFVVGELAERNPAQAEAIASAGMLIGNHSYDHPDFSGASAEDIRTNLALAQTAIYARTGVTPRWYRSPFNEWNGAYNSVLPELGLTMSWATINPRDWAGPSPQEIVDHVLAEAAPGGNVQLHDMDDRTNTIEALPGLIDALRDAGYDFVTIDDLGFSAIEGSVTDTSGAAVSGALVSAYDQQGSEVASASTRADGSYRLARLAPGTYRVGFSATGYVPRFYDGAEDLADAEPISAIKDHAIAGADATLELPDVSPPATSLSPALPDGWVNHNVVFELTASDDRSAQEILTYVRLDPPGDTDEYRGGVTLKREGVTGVTYWSVDDAGNVEAEQSATVRIDKTPPETVSDAKSEYSGSATISLIATDHVSGVGGTGFELDGSAEASGTHVVVKGRGRHALSFWSTDAAGNTGHPETVEFEITEPTVTHLSLHVADATPRYWSPTTISGHLRGSSATGSAIPEQRVCLQVRVSGTWLDSGVATTTPSGSVTFAVRPTSRSSYRLRYEGSPGDYAAAVSAVLTIKPHVSLGTPVAPDTMARRKSYTVYGSLRPRHAPSNKSVRIYKYRKVGQEWRRQGYAKAKLTDFGTYSHYRVKLTLPEKGLWRLRAHARADSGHVATWSRGYEYVRVR